MSLKESLGSLARTTGRLPIISEVIHHPAIRNTIQTWPGMSAVYGKGWFLLHPFDRIHNTDTSGFVPADELPVPAYASKTHIYAASQPSILRAALRTLPALDTFTFVDLGCGKGRPLIVASEFPFRAVRGVEFAPELAAAARTNAAIIAKEHLSRTSIQVDVGDAGEYSLPGGNLVVFLYNPFGEEVMRRVVATIESALTAEERSLYVVYYNPVCGACFDESPKLARYYAATLPYAKIERGYGPDTTDTVVIWQGGTSWAALPKADAEILVTIPSARAELLR